MGREQRRHASGEFMSLWEALILGLVEGLTEYLPVSSTGHLLVVERLLGIGPSTAANAFAIVIQAGAIVAVLGLYRERVAQMLRGIAGQDKEGRGLALALVVGFLPAGIAGLLLDDTIESVLFGPWPVVIAWAAGGVLLLALGRRLGPREGHGIGAVTLRVALIVGVAQCAALWPGVSRSLATILGGLAAGLSLVAAVEFSFLLGLVTLGAATVYKGLQAGDAIVAAYGVLPLVVGFSVAWLSAVIAVRWMLGWLSRHGLAIFGWWRLGAAAAVAVMLLTGAM
jgi:undecaprenyl-diphosphatase